MAPVTVRSSLEWAMLRLRQSPSASPRLDAELLLSSVTGRSRTQLLGWPEHPVASAHTREFRRLVEERTTGTPIAYLTGHREFMDVRLAVGPGVLVPRPETELLVEWARDFLTTPDHLPDPVVIDVGTGPGTIILTLARHFRQSQVRFIGSDISPDAIAWARRNRAALDLVQSVDLVVGDSLSWFSGRATLIAANLPYLRPDQIDTNWELAGEPRLALDGGAGGLERILRLTSMLTDRLTRRGAVALEIDPSQSEAVIALMRRHLPWLKAEVHQDLAGHDRFVTASPYVEDQP